VRNFVNSRWNRYGIPGDRLWVREAFYIIGEFPGKTPGTRWTHYRADSSNNFDNAPSWTGPWKPSIFMPRWASRILLEITNVRVERLQEITRKDAIAEGCEERSEDGAWLGPEVAFCRLWESINGPGSWEANPWVWCVSFRRIDAR
jgi:hypothetical protein